MDMYESLSTVATFRSSLHNCFGKRADAPFELVDTVLTADTDPSLVHLSLETSHRRGWGSLYAAPRHGQINAEALRSLLACHPLKDGQPIYAVDVSVWARCDAETSPERGYYYHPSRHSNGKPIVAGWSYQWIAQLRFFRDSWTAPLDVRRVHPCENPNAVAVEQIKGIMGGESRCDHAPLFVSDAGYDPVQLSRGLEGEADSLLAGCVERFRRSWLRWAARRACRNLAAGRRGGPKAAAPDVPLAIPPSRRPLEPIAASNSTVPG